MRVLVANLVPLLDKIHSLDCNVRLLPIVEQIAGNEKLAQVKVLILTDIAMGRMDEATVQAAVNFLLNWLTSTGNDNNNGPKWCKAFLTDSDVLFGRISSALHKAIFIFRFTILN